MRIEEVHLEGSRDASFAAYLLDPEISYQQVKKRPLMVICPGGGYLIHAIKEQEPIAMRFLGLGYHAIVLRYSKYFMTRPQSSEAPIETNPESAYPGPLVELMRAVAWARDNAERFAIDASRIYVIGFSAGAHLAGSLAEHWADEDLLARIPDASPEDVKPRGVIMGYPMIGAQELLTRDTSKVPASFDWQRPHIARALFGTDAPSSGQLDAIDLRKHIRPDMPRMFVWQTGEDQIVSAAETAEFASGLIDAGVSCELHIFESGQHGMALCDEASAGSAKDVDACAAMWVPMVEAWLQKDMPSKK